MSPRSFLPPPQFPHVSSRAALEAHVLNRGCFSREVNQQVYLRHFADAPRHVFRAVNRRFCLSAKLVCDVGCGWGNALAFCGPGSYGLNFEGEQTRFAVGLGLTVIERDVITSEVSDLPAADVVLCSAILEHVDSPHVLLRKCHLLLRENGILALYVPTIPLFPGLAKAPAVGRYFRGYAHSDHVNAYVPSTLRFACERAGFSTITVSPLYPPPLSFLNYVPLADRLPDGAIYVGAKCADWEYPDRSSRRVSTSAQGFELQPHQHTVARR